MKFPKLVSITLLVIVQALTTSSSLIAEDIISEDILPPVTSPTITVKSTLGSEKNDATNTQGNLERNDLPKYIPPREQLAPHPQMQELEDGDLVAGKYEVISTNGSITRSLCPYTCEMRGLPKEHCKTWKSLRDPKQCYIQDTRLPSSAMP